MRTPTVRELRAGVPELPSHATIRRMYGSASRMYEEHGYRVRKRGGQPGRRTTLARDSFGRFVPRAASEAPRDAGQLDGQASVVPPDAASGGQRQPCRMTFAFVVAGLLVAVALRSVRPARRRIARARLDPGRETRTTRSSSSTSSTPRSRGRSGGMRAGPTRRRCTTGPSTTRRSSRRAIRSSSARSRTSCSRTPATPCGSRRWSAARTARAAPRSPPAVLDRLLPLATARLVIENDFRRDLEPELWDGDANTKEIQLAGARIDELGLLPAPFPIERPARRARHAPRQAPLRHRRPLVRQPLRSARTRDASG